MNLLKTLPDDMSKFFVYHIYPATIEQDLQTDANFEPMPEIIPARDLQPQQVKSQSQTQVQVQKTQAS